MDSANETIIEEKPVKAKVIQAPVQPEIKTVNLMDVLVDHPFDTDLHINPETKETIAEIHLSKTLHQSKTFSNPMDAEKWLTEECKRLLSIEENK